MSPLKGCIYGAIASALLLILILAGVAYTASIEFEGECITFEPPAHACSLGRYLVQAVVLTIIAAPFTQPVVFFAFFFVTLGFPIAGLVVGLSGSKAST